MESIEHFIKIELVKKKMTINSLCDEIGISDVALRKMFKRNDMKISLAAKLAEVLDTDVHQIVNVVLQKEQPIGEQKLIDAMEAEITYIKELIDYKKQIVSQNESSN